MYPCWLPFIQIIMNPDDAQNPVPAPPDISIGGVEQDAPSGTVTELGVIAPSVSEIAGVVVGFETVPETPLAVATETEVTEPTVLGKLVMLAAEIVGAVWYDGAPAPPDAGPASTEFCAALVNTNVSAGVVVAGATEVVNNGDRLPALKLVTVPPPPLEGAH